MYAEGKTEEYCLEIDENNNILKVSVGGRNSWYMIGHVYMNNDFSQKFRNIMKQEYQQSQTKQEYWEDVYIRHIDVLPKMKVHRYSKNDIQEFDTIDELRLFDKSYMNDTRSTIIKQISRELNIQEYELYGFMNNKHEGHYLDFNFMVGDRRFRYNNMNGAYIERL